MVAPTGFGMPTTAHRPRNHTLYDIPLIRSVFHVIQTDSRSSLMMTDYCRNSRSQCIEWRSVKIQCIVLVLLLHLSIKFKFYSNRTRIKDTLHEDQYTFSIILVSRSDLCRMKTISDKSCVENRTTHVIVSNFFKSCRLWDNVEKYYGVWQTTDDNMAHAHCMLDT
jgi:hypothetical protein